MSGVIGGFACCSAAHLRILRLESCIALAGGRQSAVSCPQRKKLSLRTLWRPLRAHFVHSTRFRILEQRFNIQRTFSIRPVSLKWVLDSDLSVLTDVLSCPFTLVPNKAGDTPRTYLRKHLRVERSQLDYVRIARSFFAVSSERDGVILYSRCNFSGGASGVIHCFDLKYPREEKRSWDAVVTRISLSLRPLES